MPGEIAALTEALIARLDTSACHVHRL
jgi:hypothetical protein